MSVDLNVSALMFAAAYGCTGFLRPKRYLNGVYIHPHPVKGALLVATDGHRLVVIHDEDGACPGDPAIIQADKTFLGALMKVKDATARLMVGADGIATVPGHYRGAKSAVVDGTYPDYASVIVPVLNDVKRKAQGLSSFNPRYLAEFGKVGERLSKGHGAIRIRSFGGGSPALVLWPNIPYAFGVLMPVRTPDVDAIPAFFQPVLEPIAKRVAKKAQRSQQKKAA